MQISGFLQSPSTTPILPLGAFASMPPLRPLRDQKTHPDVLISPQACGFFPPRHWVRIHDVKLSSLIGEHFRVRSSRLVRFEHKLWNALAISQHSPELYTSVGVKWVSDTIFKVNKDVLGELFAVLRPGSAFFSQGGSFATHGFREMSIEHAKAEAPGGDYTDVDEVVVRLFKHTEGRFRRDSTYQDVNECTWARPV
jgi:hypothetical protein